MTVRFCSTHSCQFSGIHFLLSKYWINCRTFLLGVRIGVLLLSAFLEQKYGLLLLPSLVLHLRVHCLWVQKQSSYKFITIAHSIVFTIYYFLFSTFIYFTIIKRHLLKPRSWSKFHSQPPNEQQICSKWGPNEWFSQYHLSVKLSEKMP